jgi:two-component system, chemotaxis family, chemotaxis protein CheY
MKQILIVDDSPTMRRMVKSSLNSLPDVIFGEAGSGLEAIERLALSQFNLVILDLNMPDMHGIDVLQFLRKHQRSQFIPVIVLTTRGDEESRAAALNAGASVYLTKPFTPGSLAPSAAQLLGDE